ncbi:hypothetical protein [Desulfurobacterium sp.]
MPAMTRSEEEFMKWLDTKEYPYLYIEQSTDTFSSFFKGLSKRPDFLVIVRNFGIVAVDVKERRINPALGYTDFILDEEEEVKKYIEFERVTRLPVWFVFCKPEERYQTWYWIPLSRVLECPVKKNNNEEEFRAINVSDCIIVQTNRGDGLSRLME